MAGEKRKDKNGYVLRRGECYRSDGRYSFAYTDKEKHRHVVYAKNIVELREKEKQVLRDRDDGLDVSSATRMTLNDLIDRYLSVYCTIKIPQEVYDVNPNKNNINHTDISNTESYLILSTDGRCDEMRYEDIIRRNLELDILIERNPFERELLEGIYDLICLLYN